MCFPRRPETETAPLSALIFDSLYDPYRGVIVFCRLFDGTLKKGMKVRMMATGTEAEVVEVGYFGPGQFIPCESLEAGMVGYFTAFLKNVKDTRVGDTVTDADRPCAEALPGYKDPLPMVYCGVYPADSARYQDLRDALEKLQLNDASLQFEPETSALLWALDFAADSSACFIWRSSRRGLRENTVWIW